MQSQYTYIWVSFGRNRAALNLISLTNNENIAIADILWRLGISYELAYKGIQYHVSRILVAMGHYPHHSLERQLFFSFLGFPGKHDFFNRS